MVLLENHTIPFWEITKIVQAPTWTGNTKVKYLIALESDPMRTQVVHRNHLVEYFFNDIELPNLLSIYEKPFSEDKAKHFYNEYAKNRLFQLNQPIDSFVE